jgi:predicted Zn-dependent peptidase
VEVWIQKPPIVTSEAGIVIALWKHVGAWRDPQDKQGLAHFFEHIPFTGTRAFPDRNQLFHTISEIGGSMNASTGKIRTAYYTTAPTSQFAEAVHIVSELALRPLVRGEDIEKERGVILSELRRRYANNDIFTGDAIDKLYWKDHPLGKTAIGNEDGIKAVTAEDMRKFQSDYYHTGNLTLIVGGAFSERKDILEILEKEFSDTAVGLQSSHWPRLPFENVEEVVLEGEQYQRSLISLRWLFPLISAEEGLRQDFISSALSDALTEDRDSPLPNIIREKLGLAYETRYAYAGANFESVGFSGLIKVPQKNLALVEEIFMDCLRNLTADEVAKNRRRGQIARVMNYTDSVNAAHRAIDDISDFNRTISYKEEEDISDSVTPEEVLSFRDKILATKPWVCRVRGKQ